MYYEKDHFLATCLLFFSLTSHLFASGGDEEAPLKYRWIATAEDLGSLSWDTVSIPASPFNHNEIHLSAGAHCWDSNHETSIMGAAWCEAYVPGEFYEVFADGEIYSGYQQFGERVEFDVELNSGGFIRTKCGYIGETEPTILQSTVSGWAAGDADDLPED